MQLAVIDLGVGNLRSVAQAARAVSSLDVIVTAKAEQIASADRIILPGQGAIGSWFRELEARHLKEVVSTVLTDRPVLGICVGMQALFKFCEEDGGQAGLGLFDGSVRHFRHFHASTQERLSIPQMGWNQVKQQHPHPLWEKIDDGSNFYFLHSYCANLNNGASTDTVMGTADYHHKFIAAIGSNNVFATQFHPEKSHDDGLQLIRNFCHWDGHA